MGLGFELSESMSGSYYRLDEQLRDRAIRFSLRLEIDGLRRFVRERRVTADGTIWVDGLAEGEGRRLWGVVTMKLFDEKRVPYDLTFQGDDGRTYRLRGQRDFFLYDAMDSLTILPASLYDDENREIARAILRFDPKTALPALLRSFRPHVRLLTRG